MLRMTDVSLVPVSARELFQVFPMNACSDPRDAMLKVFLGYVALKIDHYAEDIRRE